MVSWAHCPSLPLKGSVNAISCFVHPPPQAYLPSYQLHLSAKSKALTMTLPNNYVYIADGRDASGFHYPLLATGPPLATYFFDDGGAHNYYSNGLAAFHPHPYHAHPIAFRAQASSPWQWPQWQPQPYCQWYPVQTPPRWIEWQ